MNASCCSISRHIRTFKWYIFTKNVDRRQPKKSNTKENQQNHKCIFSTLFSKWIFFALCSFCPITQRVDIKYKDAAISEALTQTKRCILRIYTNEKKNFIAKCDHASSPKQFCKSYKMVTVNYGHIRFGYRNSSIRIRIIRRLNFCKCILHSLAIYELQKKNVPFDVLFFELFFGAIDLGKRCTAAQQLAVQPKTFK